MINNVIETGSVCYMASGEGPKKITVTNYNIKEIGNNWGVLYFKDYDTAYDVYAATIRATHNISYLRK